MINLTIGAMNTIDAQTITFLNGAGRLVGALMLIAVMWQLFNKIKAGQDGKHSLLSLVWFCPVIALSFNLAVIVRFGLWTLDLIDSISKMMGFPSLW